MKNRGKRRSDLVGTRGADGGVPAVGMLLLLGFCGGDPEITPQFNPTLAPVAQRDRLYYDDSGGIQDSLAMVITDPVLWGGIWTDATSRRSTPPPQPEVDLTRSMVIVVAWGRRDPEDRIRVDSVGVHEQLTPAGDRERVFKVVVRRVEGCAGFTADVYPLEIIRVPRVEEPVAFEWRPIQRSPDCTDAGARARADTRTSTGDARGESRHVEAGRADARRERDRGTGTTPSGAAEGDPARILRSP